MAGRSKCLSIFLPRSHPQDHAVPPTSAWYPAFRRGASLVATPTHACVPLCIDNHFISQTWTPVRYPLLPRIESVDWLTGWRCNVIPSSYTNTVITLWWKKSYFFSRHVSMFIKSSSVWKMHLSLPLMSQNKIWCLKTKKWNTVMRRLYSAVRLRGQSNFTLSSTVCI